MSLRTLWLLLTLLATSACGYTFGTGLPARGVRTIALDVVGNDSYRQRLEVELNHYLTRELAGTTDLELSSHAGADAVLQVKLLDARERTLVIGIGDQFSPGFDFPRIREGAIEGSVQVRLVGRDGTLHVDQRILDRTEFRTPIGENLTTARAELAEDLARKIAIALQVDFGP